MEKENQAQSIQTQAPNMQLKYTKCTAYPG